MKRVSLSLELFAIEAAVDGARIIADEINLDTIDVKHASAAIGGILTLVGTRLRDLGRTVRGTLAVENFHAAHNAPISEEADTEDVTLPVEKPLRRSKRYRDQR